ncbi:DUF317 domain-containing protein [Streptomyces iconiensis]|uniref:DUF317 domain-containing protein n=1 Tax=Streptomyces iconiensis TaxID=1384038 RepID=A0ABT7A243_9ACTN|nr:DUF317 domain-containing protein [Streptomyces iconiensis]MDJ1135408.1 DUF317 domain-containing protein [Streptomyces iconiensis]
MRVPSAQGAPHFRWKAETMLHHDDGGAEWVWGAQIDSEAPAHATAAFAAALADPAPLLRSGDLPGYLYGRIISPTSAITPEQQATGLPGTPRVRPS